ncbi:hypothetical protein Pla123a_08350 [Posidoniimonas polymericola]|uniref:DUF1559 domain-containing protein n=1 Tax=Posidoniimonas polymericola TaxID=2528002 RepID=A0A5C5YTB3_9BACT|nr:DUF1559 domain-containing protein [Posidoniimonas polymericola]TWT78046.1 hypothetical protein Pla123a_08350 [Posidoniimonas polymericola]
MPRFTIATLLWLTALFATGMGTFEPALGIVLASFVCVLHIVRWSWPTLLQWLFIVGAIATLIALLLPSVGSLPASRRNQSISQMKQLVLALHNYYDTHGSFPPAYSTDVEGAPLHSWRTLILPYVEELPLYKAIHLDEPWDSPANATLVDGLQLFLYKNPRRPARQSLPDETHYLAVVDDEAVFRPGKPVRFQDIADGTSNTIVVIEVASRGVRWYEPRDLNMDEAIDLLTRASDVHHEWVEPGLFASTRYRGDGLYPRCVGFADGRVRSIGFVPTRELARALLTRGGGEEIPEDFDGGVYDLEDAVIGHIIHWRRVLSTALFIGLAIAPLYRRRTASDKATSEEINHDGTTTQSED